MTDEREFELLIDGWLATGSDRTPPEVIDAVRFAVRTTAQERTLPRLAGLRRVRRSGAAWQLAAVIVVVAIVGSISFVTLGQPAVGNPGRPADRVGRPDSGAPSRPLSTTVPSSGTAFAPFGFAGAGTIAYSRTDPTGLSTTWLIDPSGQRETPIELSGGQNGLQNLTGAGCCSVISPDGKHVAVGYTELGGFRGPGELQAALVLNLDGTESSLIPAFCGGCTSITGVNYVARAWSRDSAWIATEVWSDTDPGRDGINLAPVVVAANSSPDWTIQVTGAHRDVPVAFSPDGKDLLFVRITSTDRRGPLMKLAIGSGGISLITAPGRTVFADDYFGPSATWSPDGKRIAYAATDARGLAAAMQVFVSDADGREARALTDPGAFITAAAWSPDGKWIAFDRAVDRSLHREFVIRPDGTGLRNLTDGFSAGVCCGRWSPDSRALLVAGTLSDDNHSQLLIVPVDGGTISQVTTVPGFYASFSWGAVSR